MQSDNGGRHRPVAPGEHRRARQSRQPQLSAALLSEYLALQGDMDRLGPRVARDLPTADLFSKPVAETIEQEINRRVADAAALADPMPKVDQLEAERLQLRQRRKQARKALNDPMLSRLCLNNWIGARQVQAQIEASADDVEIAAGSDFVLTAVVFHHDDRALPVQELRLLGSNTLQDLAAHLVCHLQLNAPALIAALPSSFFLIEDQFFADHGHEKLSEPLLTWLHSERRFAHHGLGLFQQGPCLRRTRLDETNLRPGSIYHYVHLGSCRHALMFTEVAIVADADVRKRSAYPLQTALIKEKRQQCGICDINAAAFVTYGDRLAPTNPFFYCDACYYSMHYSEDGILLYDGYKVYPYVCD